MATSKPHLPRCVSVTGHRIDLRRACSWIYQSGPPILREAYNLASNAFDADNLASLLWQPETLALTLMTNYAPPPVGRKERTSKCHRWTNDLLLFGLWNMSCSTLIRATVPIRRLAMVTAVKQERNCRPNSCSKDPLLAFIVDYKD